MDSGEALVRWRKTTWAVVIWTALMAIWLYGMLNAENESAERYGAFYAILVGFMVLVSWCIGLIALAIIRHLSRPRPNTVVYGPQGQWERVTEEDAKKRTANGDWSYRPPSLGQVTRPDPRPRSGAPPT